MKNSTLFLRQDMTQKSGAVSVPLGNRLTNDSNTYIRNNIYYTLLKVCVDIVRL
jgi:hypothetical protein